ncbi:MAG TPA: adenylyltransferase/cytidyltransferase family protein [Skermanella sp.]|jgi:glycerol-3-phosphate cytidylyltransferase|nr:adenylyltransferase/cytidyltransferase family protein [Skermanella sp.]
MDSPETPGTTPGTARHRWRTGYASGAFDQVHIGHLRYLRAAADQCERLVVGIPSDAVVARAKGRVPLTPQAERLELVAAFACVAEALPVAVSMEDADLFAGLIAGLGIDAVFIGADWEDTPRWSRLRPRLEALGIGVIFLPRTEGISSSLLRARSGGAVETPP